MDGVAYLLSERYNEDKYGQRIPVPVPDKREIYVSEGAVSRAEWFNAGRSGLNAQHVLKTARINYMGETRIEYKGVVYGIYRTYGPPDSDEIELYLEKKAGVTE